MRIKSVGGPMTHPSRAGHSHPSRSGTNTHPSRRTVDVERSAGARSTPRHTRLLRIRFRIASICHLFPLGCPCGASRLPRAVRCASRSGPLRVSALRVRAVPRAVSGLPALVFPMADPSMPVRNARTRQECVPLLCVPNGMLSFSAPAGLRGHAEVVVHASARSRE